MVQIPCIGLLLSPALTHRLVSLCHVFWPRLRSAITLIWASFVDPTSVLGSNKLPGLALGTLTPMLIEAWLIPPGPKMTDLGTDWWPSTLREEASSGRAGAARNCWDLPRRVLWNEPVGASKAHEELLPEGTKRTNLRIWVKEKKTYVYVKMGYRMDFEWCQMSYSNFGRSFQFLVYESFYHYGRFEGDQTWDKMPALY